MDADRSKERAAQQHLLRSLGWSGVDPEAPLLALGLVSVEAAALSHTISEVFGKRPSADVLLSHPSIEALARFAAGGELEDAPTSADDVFLIGNGALRIREACLADVPHLARLEALSWPAPLAGLTAAQISARIERFAAGQLVLLEGSQVVGSLFTQRISSVSELTGGTVDFRNALSLHTDTGAVWQLLSVQVLPSHGSRGLGDMLVNYGLTVARATPGVHRAAAVTRCRTWSAGATSLESHLATGTDPGINFHTGRGASVEGVLEGWRDDDVDNLGHGVLVVYELRRFRLVGGSGSIRFSRRNSVSEHGIPFTMEESSVCTIRSVVSSDGYQTWPHGFALVATLYHSRTVLSTMLKTPGITIDELCEKMQANTGHVAVLLRTLSTLDWVTRSGTGGFCTTRSVALCANSSTVAELAHDVYANAAHGDRKDIAWGAHLPRLAKHLRSICSGWLLPEEAANVPHLGQMLAGAIIAPMLLELRMMSSTYTAKSDEGKHERASADVDLGQTDSQTAQLVADFFSYHNWGSSPAGSKRLTLNATGLFIVERCPAFGVCLSYRPMLNLLSDCCFGQPSNVFSYESGHESWVDRKLNVIGSGFMHNRYFADMMNVCIKKIFNTLPLSDQPSVVADMGCGDGTLLKTIFLYVKSHTLRGQHLETHPLTMCGVDFNEDSLKETGSTLSAANVPHGLMFGDIGDPLPMQKDLEAKFDVDRDHVLHVRSFLDHDRPFKPPSQATNDMVAEALDAGSDAVYVNNQDQGKLITPSQAFFSLVEHWERWARCLGRHGLLVLEVSNLDVASTQQYMSVAASERESFFSLAFGASLAIESSETEYCASSAVACSLTEDGTHLAVCSEAMLGRRPRFKQALAVFLRET